MDLRKYKPTIEQIELIKPYCGYQPFILSDECQSGIAHNWIYHSNLRVVERGSVTKATWKQFTRLNQKMREMYDSWIVSLCNLLGSIDNMSVCDTSANQGYFLYRLLERGAGNCIGYDLIDESVNFAVMNQITGLTANFIHTQYDMMKHHIPGAQVADIVISTAMMCHLSDPLYYLDFIGSITKKALLLFSTIDDEKNFRIIYDGAKYYYPDQSFPICFDQLNHVSSELIYFGLRELNFHKIIELHHQKNWMPKKWYKRFKTIIALK